jgi:hypothetical protein
MRRWVIAGWSCVVFGAVLLSCGGAGAASGAQTVRVLVVKATWGPQPVVNVPEITGPTATFYANASFGTLELAFTETPWLTAYADQSICGDRPGIVDQGQAAASGYAPEGYDHVIYVTPCQYVDFGSDALHRGTVGLPVTPALFEHELGHTFGISHAGALACEKKCLLDPYGNPLDVMGDGTGDFGALQKAEAGFPINVRTVSVPGTYRLAALEALSPLPQALVIHRGKVDLWIEHREAIGNDGYLRTSIWKRVTAGVLVHETPANPTSVPFNQRKPDVLIGNGGPRGIWLMHGDTFTIPHFLTIKILRHVGTIVTLRLRQLH